ncbi:hypothetical protein [Pseudonocardia sp. NPDC049635]|uniref:hypothetical protein n=1 Tax=Pseudonocardia sp. NPDC049635 TaxID=3155506 RepID=UPI00340C8EE9
MRLHHRTDGRDDAPVLVLGPSLGTDLRLFDAQVAAFAVSLDVVTALRAPTALTGPWLLDELGPALQSTAG